MQKLYRDFVNHSEIFSGEIYSKSKCMELERQIHQNIIKNLLIDENENTTEILSDRIWQKNNKTFVVCLVDEFSTCSNVGLPVQELFDKDTIVITDNVTLKQTDYKIINLPKSFFGIYAYTPDIVEFNPTRLINLPINRMDPLREVILFDFLIKTDNIFFNFNCMTHNKNETFETNFQVLGPAAQDRYIEQFNKIKDKMPMKNHNMNFEQTMYSSYVNAIVETYSAPDIVALSEKTFRALQTPSPWTLYSGIGAINYLKSLGFDVLDDIIDHGYNAYFSDNVFSPESKSRVTHFVDSTIKNAENLSKMSHDALSTRCLDAAVHNQNLLKLFKNNWCSDFDQWCNNLDKYVS
jgi:hypothetical protein